jgi:GlpG protein
MARWMPVTLILITVSVLVTLAASFGQNRQLLSPLFISEYIGGGMREVWHGQIWRLFTPIFMHFGPFPLLFNMLWLFDLGGMLERVQGSLRLGILVAIIAVVANVAQYFWAGPDFGGMSGVSYGLLGYVWMQGRLNPRNGLALHTYLVVMMLAWFVLCWADVIGNVTNMAQSVGLACGLVLGRVYSPSKALPV